MENTCSASLTSNLKNNFQLGWGRRVHLAPSLQLAQRFEGCTHFRHEERRLFPCREVRAFGKLVVVDELHIRFLCPALWRLVDLLRKRTYADRKLDAPHVEKAACWQIL